MKRKHCRRQTLLRIIIFTLCIQIYKSDIIKEGIKGGNMKDFVRLSFDVPVEEHIFIKTECAKARIPMKDFLHELVLLGLRDLREKKLMEKLKKSIQQAKEGKVRTMTLSELEKFAEDGE
jgi:hypothetical protein